MSITVVRIAPRGAPRVTLLPGFMGGPRSFDALAFHLPDDVGVRVVTLPGHGDRPSLPAADSWNEVVEAVAREIASGSVPSGPDLLLGYSMGGRVALSLALAHPDRFAHVIAVSADLGLTDEGERERRVATDEARARDIEARGVAAFVSEWETLPLFESQAGLAARTLETQRRMRLSNTEAGLAYALRKLGTGRMPDLRPALAKLAVPVTFAAGGLDAKFRALAEEGSRIAPAADWVAFHGMGHNVALEAPKKLARVVADRAARALERLKSSANATVSV